MPSPKPIPNLTTKPWCVYIRVSTEEQAQQGISLEAQLRSCQAMIQAQGFPLGNTYEDAGVSAKDLRRPALQRLLTDARAGKIGGIVVWKLDRLTRSTRDLLQLTADMDTWGVALTSVQERLDTGGAGGRFTLTMIGALAQLEREQTSERVRAVIRHKQSKGEFCGGHIPPGLRSTGANGHRTLESDPEWGPLVAESWQRVIAGATLLDVASFLTQKGVPPARKGSRWQKSNVSRLLLRKAYIGRLVDQAGYDACRGQMDARYAPTFGRPAQNRIKCHPHTNRVWMLQGIARCARCGSALVGSCHGNGRLPYLRCSGRTKQGVAFCDARNIPARPYERLVMEAIVREIGKGEDLAEAISIHLAKMRSQAAPELKRQSALELERDHLKQRIDNLFDLYETKRCSAAELGERMEGLSKRKQEVLNELARLEGITAAIGSTQFNAHAIMATLRELAGNLLELDEDRQRRIIQSLVREITIDRAKSLTITLAIPDPVKKQYPPFPVGTESTNGDLDGT